MSFGREDAGDNYFIFPGKENLKLSPAGKNLLPLRKMCTIFAETEVKSRWCDAEALLCMLNGRAGGIAGGRG